MKKLTLNQAWRLCLKQWEKGVIAKLNEGSSENVESLKKEWCDEKNYIGRNRPLYECFFCEYAEQNGSSPMPDCRMCPAKLMSKQFSCCNKTYHYFCKPRKFYKKLLQLNEKRKSKCLTP